jgi:nucleoside-diphosphate-sugar epimerase
MKGACSALQPAYGIGSAPHLFCFGFGYSARALARRLMDEGWIISGTCRSEEKRAALAARGIRAFLFDRDRPLLDAPAAFDGVTDILTSIPPDATGDPVLDQHGEVIAAARGLHWIGYLSTTGVYGDTGGAVVDETAPLCPTSERSRRRVEAERRWLDLFGARRCPCATRRRWHGQPVHVFRLAGIYGPGRSAIDQVRRGEMRRIDKPGHLFSRIHVDDIGAVLHASIARPNPGRVYNVCDDEPAEPSDVVAHACRLLGVESPPLLPFDRAASGLSPMALSFWRDNRRVDNSRIKAELGVTLAYPNYRSGLKAIAAAPEHGRAKSDIGVAL